jgi:Fibronectin type III domain
MHSARSHPFRRRWVAVGATAVLGGVLAAAPAASAATTPSVNLKVLVIDRADTAAGVYDTTTEGVLAELAREGVPYDVVTVPQANAFTTASLEDVANHRARYQGVVLADPFELDPGALAILKDVETRYGLRQVNTDAFPNADAEGLTPVAQATTLDGNTIAVTAAGSADAFGYLAGSFKADDNDSALAESQVYLTGAATPAKPGTAFTSLLDVTVGTAKGSLASVYADGGREQLTLTAAGSDDQQWLRVLAPGIVNWVTRGVNLGYHRNYFGIHIDDVFLPDSRWSSTGHCTPGDGCVDPPAPAAPITTTPIRMTPDDVTRLVTWTKAHDFAVDLAFNGSGSVQETTANGSDALLAAFQQPGSGDLFRWINHTYTHTFLGCLQIAPTVVGQTWRCATPADTTGYSEPELAADATNDTGTNTTWLSQARIENDVQQNIDWATTAKLPNFDKTVLVTGEHSGLATLPQQPVDNPNLAPALTSRGIAVTASDASRETGERTIGTTRTLPRHPMNVFYNAGTFQDEVSEYNWLYTVPIVDPATGQNSGGNCVNSTTTTCIAAPLPAGDDDEAKTSFTGYVRPIEIRNALRYVLAGDPRPFYAHQSNLAEDGILYPVLEGILSGYAGLYSTAKSPLVRTDMKGQAQALDRMTAWASARAGVTGYVDAAGVHVSGPAGAQIPLTVPASATGTTGLSAYDSGLSGWITATGGDAVVATLNPAGGGYKVAAPAAPTNVTAVAGITTATVTWAPSPVGRSDVSGWTITAATGTPAVSTPVPVTPAQVTADTAKGTLSYTVTGLTAGASYTFDVRGTNSVGTGLPSAPTAAITILGLPEAPVAVTATAGNGSAVVTWTPGPAVTGHAVTKYEVTATAGSTVLASVPTADGTTTSLSYPGLTNGTAYTFTVVAVNDLGASVASAPSTAVTPTAPVPPAPPAGGGGGGGAGGGGAGGGGAGAGGGGGTPATVAGAPTLGPVTAGDAQIQVSWTPPAQDGGSPITGYVVRVYQGTGTALVTTATATGATTRTVTGLTNGTGYSVDVAAVNALGTGAASERSAVVTPTASPTAPAKVTIAGVRRGDCSLKVAWKAPSDGGSRVTRYVVTVYRGKGTKATKILTVKAPALSAVVRALKNGTGYTVDVRAVNAVGIGPASRRSAVVVPATAPGAPAIVSVAGGAPGGKATASISWRAPRSDGGAEVVAYRVVAVRLSRHGHVVRHVTVTVRSGKTRSLVLCLPAGVYRFTVLAVNAVGAGASSAASAPVTAR